MTPAARALPLVLLAAAILLLSQNAAQPSTGATMLSWIRLINVDASNYSCDELHRKDILTWWQTKWCKKEAGHMKHIFNAANVFVRECETTFMNYRWNCSTVRYYPTEDLLSPCREQAVVAAFAAGVMVEQLVKGIRTDKLITSCLKTQKKERKQNTRKKFMCGKDYIEAEKLASKFLGVAYAPPRNNTARKDLFAYPIQYGKKQSNAAGLRPPEGSITTNYVTAHNYYIGINAIRNIKVEKCPPLGQPKCYYTVIDETLRDYFGLRYTHAMRIALVKRSKHYTLAPHRYSNAQNSDNFNNSLVFLFASNDFCDYHVDDGSKLLASLGTYHRECSPNPTQPNKCESFCCNRGFYSKNYTACFGLKCPTVDMKHQCMCSETKEVVRFFCNGPVTRRRN